MTWSAANDSCVSHSGWLVTLNTERASSLVWHWLTTQGGFQEESGPYIGLYRPEDTEESARTFRWVQGARGDDMVGAYQDWAPGYPTILSGAENCVYLTTNGQWGNCACDNLHSFVCETSGVVGGMGGLDNTATGGGYGWVVSVGVSVCVLLGCVLIYYGSIIRDKASRIGGTWAPLGRGGGKDSPGPFSAVDDDTESITSSHALVDTDGMDISRFDQNYGQSPEESMEIQLQLRSYTPVYDGR